MEEWRYIFTKKARRVAGCMRWLWGCGQGLVSEGWTGFQRDWGVFIG
jgi:hypothetical protein